MSRKAKDLTGMRFGRLVVLCDDGTRTKQKKIMWKCQCDCGNITYVRASFLTNKKRPTLSCGCLHKEVSSIKMRETNKELWQDEEYKQMHSDKMREIAKELWQDEKYKQMMSDKMRAMVNEKWQDEEYRQMQSDKTKGRWQDEETKWKMGYKGGITPISIYLRNKNEEWHNKCKQEANYTCQLTGKQGQLHTHHLYAFSLIVVDAHNTYDIEVKQQIGDYTEEELKLLEEYVADWHKDSSNAVVLSEEAHRLFHNLYGKGNNTKEQYEEFKQRYLNGEFDDLI